MLTPWIVTVCKSIIEFPAIAEIIALMRAKADASRSMLYETARFVDVYKALDDISKDVN